MLLALFLVSAVLFCAVAASAAVYEVDGNRILRDGKEVQFFGLNWFGAETQDHVVHGLWSRNYADMVEQIVSLGFNAVRLPFCPATLEDVSTTSINTAVNPTLLGLGSLEVLDEIVATLDVPGRIADMTLVDGPVGPYSCDVAVPATGRSGKIAIFAAIMLGGLYVLRRRR